MPGPDDKDSAPPAKDSAGFTERLARISSQKKDEAFSTALNQVEAMFELFILLAGKLPPTKPHPHFSVKQVTRTDSEPCFVFTLDNTQNDVFQAYVRDIVCGDYHIPVAVTTKPAQAKLCEVKISLPGFMQDDQKARQVHQLVKDEHARIRNKILGKIAGTVILGTAMSTVSAHEAISTAIRYVNKDGKNSAKPPSLRKVMWSAAKTASFGIGTYGLAGHFLDELSDARKSRLTTIAKRIAQHYGINDQHAHNFLTECVKEIQLLHLEKDVLTQR